MEWSTSSSDIHWHRKLQKEETLETVKEEFLKKDLQSFERLKSQLHF
jgi:hypothetical protein